MAQLAVVGNLQATQTCPSQGSGEPVIQEAQTNFRGRQEGLWGKKKPLDFPVTFDCKFKHCLEDPFRNCFRQTKVF